MTDQTDACPDLAALSVKDFRGLHASPVMKRSARESADPPPALDLGPPAAAKRRRIVHVLSVSVPAAHALRVRVHTTSGPTEKTLRVSFECV